MASKYILVIVDGAIVRAPIRKPAAPRQRFEAWHSNCVEAARKHKAVGYAFRLGGDWVILSTAPQMRGQPIRKFETEDAAAMWLLYNG